MIKEFVELFFPNLCIACNNNLLKQEEFLCTRCLYELPQTDYHKFPENNLVKAFWGRVPLQHAFAFLYFRKKGAVKSLLHSLKYAGGKEVTVFLGRYYGQKLADAGITFDAVVAIPLHPDKLRKRGYNQSACFAEGLAQSMGMDDLSFAVERTVATETQTKKDRFERWQNVGGVFKISDAAELTNKRLLVVDDVITTGATIEGLCKVILAEVPCTIAVAAIATPQD